MGLDNTWWKLRAAVEHLATSTSTLQERLFTVYLSHLITLNSAAHEWDLPPALSPIMELIHQRMTSVSAVGNEGDLRATVEAMTDDDAVEVAKLVVQLHYDVQAALSEHGDLRFPRRAGERG